MVLISENFAPNQDPVHWPTLKRTILAALDPVAEYEALGVRFTDRPISIKGWKDCYAAGREDSEPSAAVNILSPDWIYHDRGGEGKSINFFDFALKYGPWGTWIECVRAYAAKAGIAIGAVERSSRGDIVEEVYRYCDATGAPAYGVFRHRRPNGKKDFRQYPLRDGRWVKEKGCMEGVTPLPYRLPELLAAADDEVVLCVEGEKDVEAAYAHGFVATTGHQGAASTDRTWGVFAPTLPRRDYCVIPDNDVAGRTHAAKVCGHLFPVARSVRYLALPGLPPGGDLSDWFGLGGTAEELGQLIYAAPRWTPEAAAELAAAAEATAAADPLDEDATAHDLILAQATVRWVVPGWIPVGVLTALASEPGVGKSRFCADLLRTVARGEPTWFDGSPNELPAGGRAIWVAADNQHRELGGFPAEFGFPPECLVLNTSRRNVYGGTMLDAVEDLVDFERRINRIKPVFVFVDTTLNATDRSANKPEDAKAFFKPLQEIAARTQTAILCVTHLNADGKPLGRRIQGQARVVISLSHPDPDGQPHRRRLWVSKSNSLYPPPLGVTMGTGGNTYDLNPPSAPEGAEDGGEASRRKAAKSARTRACAAWLKALLGERTVAVVKVREAMDSETDFSAPLLYRAKDLLGVREEEISGRKWWSLPPEAGGAPVLDPEEDPF